MTFDLVKRKLSLIERHEKKLPHNDEHNITNSPAALKWLRGVFFFVDYLFVNSKPLWYKILRLIFSAVINYIINYSKTNKY